MTRKKQRAHLQLESLECRLTPALVRGGLIGGIGGAVLDPGDRFNPQAISITNGVITATGTHSADLIQIDHFDPALTQRRLPGTTFPLEASIQVRVMDATGVVRKDAAGNLLDRFFPVNGVNSVKVLALGGNDRIIKTTTKTMDASGGEGHDTFTASGGLNFHKGDGGNDVFFGGTGIDSIDGGLGNDTMNGGASNDIMLGGLGNDRMRGDAGNDLMNGQGDQDSLNGGDGHDTVSGESGEDFIFGGIGNDHLFGGDHRDFLLGENDDDVLHGDAGPDVLSGGSGNDILYGGADNDDLQGFAGNDGLFGGGGWDTLSGGQGIDRFLRWTKSGNTTSISDRASNESLTTFKGTTTRQVVNNDPGLDLRYDPGEWTEKEIEAVDAGMAWLHADVGNTKMLKLKSGGNLTMVRYGTYVPYDDQDGIDDDAESEANDDGASFIAYNFGNGTISFVEVDLNRPIDVIETTIHELAHNWENENPRYAEWLALSGWVETDTPNADQILSRDGQWVYGKTATFARNYGKTNPYEDFATSFEAYYQFKNNRLSTRDIQGLIPKLNFIGLFITTLS